MALGVDVEPGGAGISPRYRPKMRGRLATKYFLFVLIAVSVVLLASSTVQTLYGYNDQVTALNRTQQQQADTAAKEIEQFVATIEQELSWTILFPWVEDPELFERRRADASLVLSRVPAVTELTLVDSEGRERVRVSALQMDVVNSGRDLVTDPAFLGALARGAFYGPVYYRNGSEPYFTLAIAGNRPANGVAIAEVNLVFLWELVSAMEVGSSGWAFVVDQEGRLIAHPDVTRVLRGTDYSALPQVAAALGGGGEAAATGPGGQQLISAFAPVPPLGWFLFAELPTLEALAPIYKSLARSGIVLLLGLALAGAAAFILARRMVGPIRAIERGAARIGEGDLSHRISVNTSDEIESLAVQFNDMTARLQQSLTTLERRVEERTAQLAEKSEQLELASQHKSQFLANMSHELRTPLNAVLGYAELLVHGYYGPLTESSQEVLDRIQWNAKHLLLLINDVLDLSKIEAGELRLHFESYDLLAIVNEVVASTGSLASKKNLRLGVVASVELPKGYGDAQRIRQVTLNLVGNAIKFTDDGFVELTVGRKDGFLELEVVDSGPGIDPARQRDIFREFLQVENSDTRSRGGTGLGLAISKRIVEMHNGSIGVRSRVGAGATFWVLLPTTHPEGEG